VRRKKKKNLVSPVGGDNIKKTKKKAVDKRKHTSMSTAHPVHSRHEFLETNDYGQIRLNLFMVVETHKEKLTASWTLAYLGEICHATKSPSCCGSVNLAEASSCWRQLRRKELTMIETPEHRFQWVTTGCNGLLTITSLPTQVLDASFSTIYLEEEETVNLLITTILNVI
jgi:hypothetical protein